MRFYVLFLILYQFIAVPLTSFGQNVESIQYIEKGPDQVILTDDISIPGEDAGFTLILPGPKVDGAMVFFNSDRDTINKIFHLASQHHLAVIFVTTGNRLDFLFHPEDFLKLEKFLEKALVNYNIPRSNLLFCGMSLAGTRALRFIMFSQSEHSNNKILPKAIAICDPPIDFVRFYKECKKAYERNLNPIAANEGKWVSQLLLRNLGDPAELGYSAYIEYSPYSYESKKAENTLMFKDFPIRIYTEPDVEWWIKNRGKDYRGMNAIDAAGMINLLQILGNKHAELITTSNKGYLPDGTRHPHSWSIVDEDLLIDWFLSL